MNECGRAAEERELCVWTGVDVEGPATVELADSTRLAGLRGRGCRRHGTISIHLRKLPEWFGRTVSPMLAFR